MGEDEGEGDSMAHKKKEAMERFCEFGDVKIPILEIPVHHQPSLIIGRLTGRAILDHLDSIRSFVEKHEKSETHGFPKTGNEF